MLQDKSDGFIPRFFDTTLSEPGVSLLRFDSHLFHRRVEAVRGTRRIWGIFEGRSEFIGLPYAGAVKDWCFRNDKTAHRVILAHPFCDDLTEHESCE